MSSPVTGSDVAERHPEQQPRVGDVPWGVGDAVVVLLLAFAASIVFGGLFMFVLRRTLTLDETQTEVAGLIIGAVVVMSVTIGYVAVRYGAVRRLFGPAGPSLRAVGVGVLVGLAGLIAIAYGLGELLEAIAAALESELPEIQENFREIAGNPASAPLLVVSAVLVVPLAEELFYRGMLFAALRRHLPVWPALGISAAVFGLSHLETSLDGYLFVVLLIIPFGIMLAWAYERTGTLVVPIVAHAVFNLAQVLALISSA